MVQPREARRLATTRLITGASAPFLFDIMTEAETKFIMDQQIQNLAKLTGGTVTRLTGVNSNGEKWEKIEIVYTG